MWLEESNDIIRSCAQLSSMLGIQKSFSTSDITQLPSDKFYELNSRNGGSNNGTNPYSDLQSNSTNLRHALSDMALNSIQRCGYMLDTTRLDHTSRSCSTWVAVGELASTSQLPSPHGGPVLNVNTSSSQQQLTATTNTSIQSSQPTFTTADLIRSVNKKVRQNYIRSRLLTTYRAIERLSQSEFNLDKLIVPNNPTSDNPNEMIIGGVAGAGASAIATSATETINEMETERNNQSDLSKSINIILTTPTNDSGSGNDCGPASFSISIPNIVKTKPNVPLICPELKKKISININRNLTINDIEKERGRPLSKYDRNMMIFNWLHSLDETSTVEEYN